MNTLLPNLLYGGGVYNIKGINGTSKDRTAPPQKNYAYRYIYNITQITSLTTLFEKYVIGFCYSIYVFLFSGKISNMK